MTAGGMSALTWTALALPFPFALGCAFTGRAERARRMLVSLYAIAAPAVAVALLNGFLDCGRDISFGWFSLDRFSFPLFLVLDLASAGCALYAGFRRSGPGAPLTATVLAGSGLALGAVLAVNLAAQVILFEGVTAAALAGLAAQGAAGLRRRLAAFAPWLLSDGLFVAGAVLCAVLLGEGATLVTPPPASGGELEVVAVAALFLAAALIRLGVFPFHFWQQGLIARGDPAWNAFFLGSANFTLSGARAVLAVAFVGRLVAGDWSRILLAAGLVSVAAGPALAIRRSTGAGFLAGMYTMQAGFLMTGLGLFSRSGLEGSLFCLAAVPLSLTASLMALGTADADGGGEGRFGERARARRPAAFAALLASGMALAGLPPTDGFVAKALVSLAGIDKSSLDPLCAAVAAVCLLGVGFAAVALARTIAGMFAAPAAGPPAGGRRSAMEPAVALSFCGGGLFLGLFPGTLLRNFISGGSLGLFGPGFTGPGIAFRGTGRAVAVAVARYDAWAPEVAAFLLAVSVMALCAYFATRPALELPAAGGRQ